MSFSIFISELWSLDWRCYLYKATPTKPLKVTEEILFQREFDEAFRYGCQSGLPP